MKIFRLLTASLLIAVCAELGSCSSEEEIPTLLEIDCQQAENFLSEESNLNSKRKNNY